MKDDKESGPQATEVKDVPQKPTTTRPWDGVLNWFQRSPRKGKGQEGTRDQDGRDWKASQESNSSNSHQTNGRANERPDAVSYVGWVPGLI